MRVVDPFSRRGALTVAILLSLAGCTDPGTRSDVDGGDPRPRVDAGCHEGSPDDDADRDGWTEAMGDCDDCLPRVNPGAFDDPGNAVDEDCRDGVATTAEACDVGLALASEDASDGARAVGLCHFTTETTREWGVLSARWTRADGTGTPLDPRQHGLMPQFGVLTARGGGTMLALSSGAARAPSQPGFTSGCDEYGLDQGGAWPAGLERTSPACPGVTGGDVYDPIALEVRLRVPTNAAGLQFESNFFTYEYPYYICSEYNDFFVVLMEPRPGGSRDGNIVFDAAGNKVSVNSTLLRACTPGTHGGRTFACDLGTESLADTSYDDSADCGQNPDLPVPPRGPIGASTGWLRTQVQVEGGSIITLRFAIWDAGDPDLDSLTLIDSFTWLVEDPGEASTDPVLF
ncbi:choice-of-anchor L domain-containing protein [Sandaracinus amylolyticus]|uniref:choice-of-anchor L domain-containing protein n=1 Tax=Sandaracinus amylolyticus TaxID=927083 RepID=UPI001F3BCE1F|nr:choice-of-anchor L domain-containing protein [Sandaracinus amylolyticus]UJR81423.1 Protein metal binding site [Sandaracinus amylolyticus]